MEKNKDTINFNNYVNNFINVSNFVWNNLNEIALLGFISIISKIKISDFLVKRRMLTKKKYKVQTPIISNY